MLPIRNRIDAAMAGSTHLDAATIDRVEKRYMALVSKADLRDQSSMFVLVLTYVLTSLMPFIGIVGFGRSGLAIAMIAAMPMVGVMLWGYFQMTQRRQRRAIRRALLECGVLICLKCGYPLGDLKCFIDHAELGIRCPECGASVGEP